MTGWRLLKYLSASGEKRKKLSSRKYNIRWDRVKIWSHQGELIIWWGDWVSMLQGKCDRLKTCDLYLVPLFYLCVVDSL
jgi:hypothetical protein